MSVKTKVGILGGGGILNAHIAGFRAARDLVEVVAVAEPRRDREEFLRAEFGEGVCICSDYHDVVAMADVSAVDIILPHDLHMPATLAAADAGKDVLVEKVMARNIYECDRMIEVCEGAGVSLTVCHDRRYHPQWVALKTVVDSGALGDMFFLKLEHNQNVVLPEGHWARSRDGIGGGAIMSCLTHQVDALRWYGGEVESVTCMTKTMPERMEGEFLGLMGAKMRSGALGQLSINWWTESGHSIDGLWYELVHVCGTKGEAFNMTGRGTFVKLHEGADEAALEQYGAGAGEGFVKVDAPAQSGHEVCIVEWARSLAGLDATITTTGRDSRRTVEVAEAAYRSEESGRTVSLPIEPKPWAE